MIDEKRLIKTLEEWIPVTERVPENDDDVLVWYECFSYGFNNIHQRYGIGCYCNNR